jgi:hypothetical protein
MDRVVDQAGGPGPTHRGGTPEAGAGTDADPEAEADMDETAELDATGELDETGESDAQDIESELYSSTREAGIAAAGFAPIPDG